MRITILFSLCLLSSFLFAQKPTGEIQDAELIIEKEKELTLPVFNRFFKPAVLPVTKSDPKNLTFRYTVPEFQLPVFEPNLSVSKLEKAKESPFYTHQLLVGFGNYLSPLLDYKFQYLLKNDHQFGLQLNHESFNTGPVRDRLSAETFNGINGWYLIKGKKADLQVNTGYRRLGNYYYGINDSLYFANETIVITEPVIAEQYKLGIQISGDLAKGKGSYSVSPEWSNFSQEIKGNTNFNQENLISFSSGINLKLNGKWLAKFATNTYSSIYTSGTTISRNLIAFEPSVFYNGDVISLTAGGKLNLVNESGRSIFYVMPDLSIQYKMLDRVSMFASLDGSAQINSLESIIAMNPLLEDSLSLKSTIERFNVKAGINGFLFPSFSYQVFLSASEIVNQQMFVNSFSDSSRFSIQYDNTERLSMGYSLNYKAENQTVFTLSVQHFKYNMNSEFQPWHLPTFIATLNSTFIILKKLEINPELSILDGIKGRSAFDGTSVDLPQVIGAALRLNYPINNQHFIFFQFNNMLNRENVRFLNYQNRGIMLKAGISMHF